MSLPTFGYRVGIVGAPLPALPGRGPRSIGIAELALAKRVQPHLFGSEEVELAGRLVGRFCRLGPSGFGWLGWLRRSGRLGASGIRRSGFGGPAGRSDGEISVLPATGGISLLPAAEQPPEEAHPAAAPAVV